MFRILRSRPSQMLVAVLCVLVLSRMSAPMCAEDALSSLVKIEESHAITPVLASTPGVALGDSAVAIPIETPVRPDAPNPSLIEHSILRL